MFPIRKRISTRSTVEFLGASRDAMSTVTLDHVGFESARVENGVQYNTVPSEGSGLEASGVT